MPDDQDGQTAQERRPQDDGCKFGLGDGQEPGRRHQKRRDPQVDIARPVDRDAFGRQHAVLLRVEPGLAGQPVAHLLQAHQVVAVTAHQQFGNLRHASRDVQDQDGDGTQADPPDGGLARFGGQGHVRSLFPGRLILADRRPDHL